MAQVTNISATTTSLTTTVQNYRSRARFRYLPDGKHEHSLVNIRGGATATDTLRYFISARWKKQQVLNAEEVGSIADSASEAI
jgi:hypothetical protein